MTIRDVFFVFALIIQIPVFSQTSLDWRIESAIPDQGRRNGIYGVIDDTLYVGLGPINGYTSFSDEFWGYDINTRTWDMKEDYPGSGRAGSTCFTINGKLYVCCGTTYPTGNGSRKNDMYMYDPSSDSWTQKANYPGTARTHAVAFVIDGKAYVGMGDCGGGCFLNDFYMYDPGNNTWTQKANFPGGTSSHGVAFADSSYGYVGCYRNAGGTIYNNFYRYNPSSNSWNAISSMPGTARMKAKAFVLDNKGYVGCGVTSLSSDPGLTDFYSYNTQSDSWTHHQSLPPFSPRYVPCVYSVGDTAVFLGFGATYETNLSGLYKLKLDYDTCDYIDTLMVYDTITIYDTITHLDTIAVYDTIQVYDTLIKFVTYYDTVVVFDTLTHIDSIEYVDTVYHNHFDTTEVTIYYYDTVTVYVIDTIYYNVPVYDTITVYVIDTIYHTLYDTVWTYDTAIITTYYAVADTLVINLYEDGSGCGGMKILLYPNPTNDYFYIFTKNDACIQGAEAILYTELGQVLDRQTFTGAQVAFNLKGYARAVYIVKVVNPNGQTMFVRKVLLE